METETSTYQAYMLRFWAVQDSSGLSCRISLENPHDGQRRYFPNLNALIAFLRDQFGDQPHPMAAD